MILLLCVLTKRNKRDAYQRPPKQALLLDAWDCLHELQDKRATKEESAPAQTLAVSNRPLGQ
jgi:hypothetical protein